MCMSQLVLCNTPPRIQLPRPTGVSLPVAQWVGWLFWAGRLQAAFSEPAGRLLVWQIPSTQESRQATETEGGPLTSTSLPSARARPRPSPAAVSREAPPPPGRPGRGPNPIRGREELAAPSRPHPHPWALGGTGRQAVQCPHQVERSSFAALAEQTPPCPAQKDMAGSSSCPWGWEGGLMPHPPSRRALDWQAAPWTQPKGDSLLSRGLCGPPALPAFTSGVVTVSSNQPSGGGCSCLTTPGCYPTTSVIHAPSSKCSRLPAGRLGRQPRKEALPFQPACEVNREGGRGTAASREEGDPAPSQGDQPGSASPRCRRLPSCVLARSHAAPLTHPRDGRLAPAEAAGESSSVPGLSCAPGPTPASGSSACVEHLLDAVPPWLARPTARTPSPAWGGSEGQRHRGAAWWSARIATPHSETRFPLRGPQAAARGAKLIPRPEPQRPSTSPLS